MAVPTTLTTLATAGSDGQEFTSSGYYTPGDGGHLTYRYNSSSTLPPDGADADHPGLVYRPTAISGSNPGRWIAQVDRSRLLSQWFGAKGDNTQDDTLYLQAWIDRCINASGLYPWRFHDLFLLTGLYKTTDMLNLGYGSGDFACVNLIGSARQSRHIWGSQIRPTFTNKPVINIQGLKASSVQRIGIVGTPTAPAAGSAYSAWTAVFPDTQNQQFAGISIDAFSGADPGGTRYTAPSGWSKYHSGDIRIDECHFENLGCGVIQKPVSGTGADNNGDYVSMEQSTFETCKYAFSVNGSQARRNSLSNCRIESCYAAVGIGWYGPSLGGDVFIGNGTAIERTNWIVKGRSTEWVGRITIEDCFGEDMSGCLDVTNGGGVCNVNIEKNNLRTKYGSDSTVEERQFVSALGCNVNFSNNTIVSEGTTRSSVIIGCDKNVICENNIVRREAASYGAPLLAVVPAANLTGIKARVQNTATKFGDLVPSPVPGLAGVLIYSATYTGSKRYSGTSEVILWNGGKPPTADTIIATKLTSDNNKTLLFKIITAATTQYGTWVLEQINECDGTNPISSSDTLTRLGSNSITYFMRGREFIQSGKV